MIVRSLVFGTVMSPFSRTVRSPVFRTERFIVSRIVRMFDSMIKFHSVFIMLITNIVKLLKC